MLSFTTLAMLRTGWIYISYSSRRPRRGSHTAVYGARITRRYANRQEGSSTKGEKILIVSAHYGSRIAFLTRDGICIFNRCTVAPFEMPPTTRPSEWRQDLQVYMTMVDPCRQPSNTADPKPEVYSYGTVTQQGLTMNPMTDRIWEA